MLRFQKDEPEQVLRAVAQRRADVEVMSVDHHMSIVTWVNYNDLTVLLRCGNH